MQFNSIESSLTIFKISSSRAELSSMVDEAGQGFRSSGPVMDELRKPDISRLLDRRIDVCSHYPIIQHAMFAAVRNTRSRIIPLPDWS